MTRNGSHSACSKQRCEAAWAAGEFDLRLPGELLANVQVGEPTGSDAPTLSAVPKDALLAELPGHGENVCAVAFSRDGRSLAAAGTRVKVWDLSTKEARTTLEGYPHWLHHVAIAPDLTRLAAGSSGGDVIVWDISTEQVVGMFPSAHTISHGWDKATEQQREAANAVAPLHVSLSCVAFSPDGQTLATCGTVWLPEQRAEMGAVKLWDLRGGALRAVLGRVDDKEPVQAAGFSPDGRGLVTVGKERGVTRWDLETGRPVHPDFAPDPRTRLYCTVISPDGRTVAVPENTIILYDLNSGQARAEFCGHWSCVNSVAFSPDGLLIASGGLDPGARIWEARTGRLRAILHGHAGEVWSVAFSPDGATLAAGDKAGTVRLWDVRRALDGALASAMALVAIGNAWRSREWGVGQSAQAEAMHWLSDAILLDPGCREAFLARGLARRDRFLLRKSTWFENDEYSLAAEDFTAASRLAPDRPDAYRERAVVRALRGKRHQALVDANAAIRLDPRSPDGHRLRGDLRAFAGDASGAATDYSSAIALAPKAAECYFRRGLARAAAGDSAAALADVKLALRRDLAHIGALSLRGLVYFRQGNYQSAIKDGLKLLVGGPDAEVLFRLGVARAALGRHEQAVADFTHAIEVDRKNAHKSGVEEHPLFKRRAALLPLHRGRSQVLLGRFDEAVSDFAKYIEHRPRKETGFLHRAFAYHGLGEPDLAEGDLKRAIRLDKRYAALREAFAAGGRKLVAAAARLTDLGDVAAAAVGAAKAVSPHVPDPVRQIARLNAHADAVMCVSLSADGCQAVSGSRDGMIKLWDMARRKEVRRLVGHEGAVNGVVFSCNGKHAVSAGADGTVRVWPLEDGERAQIFRGHAGNVLAVACSADGQMAHSVGEDQTLRSWPLFAMSGKGGAARPRAVKLPAVPYCLASSPNGLFALVGGGSADGDAFACVIDLATRKVICELSDDPVHRDTVCAVAFTPNGQFFVSGGGSGQDIWGEMIDSDVRLWDLRCRIVRMFTGHEDAVFALAASPDSRRILTATGEGTIRVWDLASGRELRRLRGHQGAVRSVAYSPDGRFILSGGEDKTLRFWGRR